MVTLPRQGKLKKGESKSSLRTFPCFFFLVEIKVPNPQKNLWLPPCVRHRLWPEQRRSPLKDAGPDLGRGWVSERGDQPGRGKKLPAQDVVAPHSIMPCVHPRNPACWDRRHPQTLRPGTWEQHWSSSARGPAGHLLQQAPGGPFTSPVYTSQKPPEREGTRLYLRPVTEPEESRSLIQSESLPQLSWWGPGLVSRA